MLLDILRLDYQTVCSQFIFYALLKLSPSFQVCSSSHSWTKKPHDYNTMVQFCYHNSGVRAVCFTSQTNNMEFVYHNLLYTIEFHAGFFGTIMLLCLIFFERAKFCLLFISCDFYT